MKISLIQLDIVWEDIEANLHKVDRLLETLNATDMVVLPEMFSTGFSMNTSMAEGMDGKGVKKMLEWASAKELLVCGSLMIREDDKFHNRFIAAYPDGSMHTYDKRHLFTFANEDQYFTPGASVATFDYKGWTFLPQICYDVRFPSFSRYSKKNAFDVMIYVANFPNKRISAWNQLLPARAIENQAYVVAVNRYGLDGTTHYYDGSSQVIDFSGKVIYRSAPGEHVHTVSINKASVDRQRSKFPFLQDRDLK